MSMNKLRDMIYTDVLLNLCAIVPRKTGSTASRFEFQGVSYHEMME